MLNNSAATSQLEATAGAHFILTGDYISNTTYGVIRAAGNDFCLNLNGHALGNNGTGYVLRLGANTVNIYGEGNVINTADGNYMFDFSQGGTLNIYGGTYTNSSTAKGMFEGQAQTYVNLYGGTFNVNPATYTDNEIANVTVADGFEVKDNGDGTWSVVEKQAPAEPELPANCECCGAQNVTWTVLSGTTGSQLAPVDGTHYILTDDFSSGTGGNVIHMTGTATVCVNLNGHKLESTNAASGKIARIGACTLNIFGEGEVTNAEGSTANMFDFNQNGTLNIYGGTYTHNGTTKGMFEGQAQTYVNIYGGTFNVNPATYTDNEIANVTIADGFEAKDNGNGTWTIVEKQTPVGPVLPTTCPGCGAENVQWHAITGEEGKQIYPGDAEFPGNHYYLANEITITGGYRFFRAYSGVNSCLYLNGQTLNYNGTGVVFHAGGQTVNICGEGTVTNSGSGNMFDYNGAGRVNICGGTYVQSGTGAMFTDKVCVDGQTTHALISGGTFNCNPAALTFTNRNVVTFAEGLGAADLGGGNWTVTSKTRICSGCNKIVEPELWETYTGQHDSAEKALTAEAGHKHYKLAEDFNYNATGYGFYVTTGTACFDLAGHGMYRTSGGTTAFYNDAGLLNIIDSVGGDAVVYGGANDSTIKTGSAAATVNLYGGTFNKVAGANTKPVVNLELGGTVNLYEGATITTAGASNNRGGACVRLMGNAANKAVFNMFGGTVTVGNATSSQSATNPGGAITLGRPAAANVTTNAEVNISGGTVTGGNLANAAGDCIFIDRMGKLTISGNAIINGEVALENANSLITLSGAPKILAVEGGNALVLGGALANIDTLEATAQIQVTGAAGTALTAASENAANVAGAFAATGDGLTVTNENGQLVIVENLLQAAAMTLKAVLTGLF